MAGLRSKKAWNGRREFVKSTVQLFESDFDYPCDFHSTFFLLPRTRQFGQPLQICAFRDSPQRRQKAGAVKVLALSGLVTLFGMAMYFFLPSTWVAGSWTTPEPWESETGARRVVTVQTMKVQPSDTILSYRFFSGIIKAKQTSKLSFQRIGNIESILVSQGDAVTKGQLIAKLDSRRLEAKKQTLQSQWEGAKAVLAELMAGPRKEDIASQRATVEDWKAQVESAKSLSDRRTRLAKKSAVSAERAEQAKFSLASMIARHQVAVRQLDRLLAGTRTEKIDAQKAKVQQLAASVKDVELEIELSQIIAPYDGHITKRMVDSGTVVSPSQTIIELIEDSEVEAWVGVPAEFAKNLKENQNLDVLVSTQNYSCIVKSIVPSLDARTLTQSVVLTVAEQTPTKMAPGTVVRLKIPVQKQTKGFWVPVTSLLRQGEGLWSVYCVAGKTGSSSSSKKKKKRNRLILKSVEVRQLLQDEALVEGTLRIGDILVTDGIHRLTPGQRVKTKKVSDGETTNSKTFNSYENSHANLSNENVRHEKHGDQEEITITSKNVQSQDLPPMPGMRSEKVSAADERLPPLEINKESSSDLPPND